MSEIGVFEFMMIFGSAGFWISGTLMDISIGTNKGIFYELYTKNPKIIDKLMFIIAGISAVIGLLIGLLVLK